MPKFYKVGYWHDPEGSDPHLEQGQHLVAEMWTTDPRVAADFLSQLSAQILMDLEEEGNQRANEEAQKAQAAAARKLFGEENAESVRAALERLGHAIGKGYASLAEQMAPPKKTQEHDGSIFEEFRGDIIAPKDSHIKSASGSDAAEVG